MKGIRQRAFRFSLASACFVIVCVLLLSLHYLVGSALGRTPTVTLKDKVKRADAIVVVLATGTPAKGEMFFLEPCVSEAGGLDGWQYSVISDTNEATEYISVLSNVWANIAHTNRHGARVTSETIARHKQEWNVPCRIEDVVKGNRFLTGTTNVSYLLSPQSADSKPVAKGGMYIMFLKRFRSGYAFLHSRDCLSVTNSYRYDGNDYSYDEFVSALRGERGGEESTKESSVVPDNDVGGVNLAEALDGAELYYAGTQGGVHFFYSLSGKVKYHVHESTLFIENPFLPTLDRKKWRRMRIDSKVFVSH